MHFLIAMHVAGDARHTASGSVDHKSRHAVSTAKSNASVATMSAHNVVARYSCHNGAWHTLTQTQGCTQTTDICSTQLLAEQPFSFLQMLTEGCLGSSQAGIATEQLLCMSGDARMRVCLVLWSSTRYCPTHGVSSNLNQWLSQPD